MIKWKAYNTASAEMVEIESSNKAVTHFEEVKVWTPSGKEAFIVGAHKWEPLQLTEESAEALKHVITRANGASYFTLKYDNENGNDGIIVQEAVLQADGNMFIRSATWITK